MLIIKLNGKSKLLFPVSDNAIRLSWDKLRKRSGLQDIRFHDLRHEAIRGFFERVLNIAEVALTWGHKDPRMLKRYAEDIAKKLKIYQSAAITCVKPSGTVSQLVDSASGIHTRHNPYYIRTVRCDKKDPLTQLMIDQGVPNEPDITKPDSVTVFSFPTASPTGSITRNSMSAIEQLELWLKYQREWCEHKPSVTVSVKEDEWMEVGSWVYKYFDEVYGISLSLIHI